MTIERDSVHFQILDRLCAMPRAVRGSSGAVLEREYGAPWAIEELANLGLIRARGWANGPGVIWIPTEAGLVLHRELGADRPKPAPSPRWVRSHDGRA